MLALVSGKAQHKMTPCCPWHECLAAGQNFKSGHLLQFQTLYTLCKADLRNTCIAECVKTQPSNVLGLGLAGKYREHIVI